MRNYENKRKNKKQKWKGFPISTSTYMYSDKNYYRYIRKRIHSDFRVTKRGIRVELASANNVSRDNSPATATATATCRLTAVQIVRMNHAMRCKMQDARCKMQHMKSPLALALALVATRIIRTCKCPLRLR